MGASGRGRHRRRAESHISALLRYAYDCLPPSVVRDRPRAIRQSFFPSKIALPTSLTCLPTDLPDSLPTYPFCQPLLFFPLP